jgi:surfactin synthase thioesterase subunit
VRDRRIKNGGYWRKGNPAPAASQPLNLKSETTAHRSRPKGNKMLAAAVAAAALIGVPTLTYLEVRKKYRAGFEKSATMAEERAKDIAVKPLKARQHTIILGAGGMAYADDSPEVVNGERMITTAKMALSKDKGKDLKLIPINSKDANISKATKPKNVLEQAKDALKVHYNNVVKHGRNPAAVEMAAQAIAWSDANPDKQIVLMGHSYGGNIVFEAQEILRKSRPNLVDRLKSFAIGSRWSGFTQKFGESYTIGSKNDPDTSLTPTRDLKNFNDVKGHTQGAYFSSAAVKKFMQNVIYRDLPDSKTERKDAVIPKNQNKPQRAGYIWVRDRRVKNGGYWRKFKPDQEGLSKPQVLPSNTSVSKSPNSNSIASSFKAVGLSALGGMGLIGGSILLATADAKKNIAVDFGSIRQPKDGIPDEETFKTYDTFKPGDLIRKNFNLPGIGAFRHYGVYYGKDPQTGQHLIAEVDAEHQNYEGGSVFQIKPINKSAGKYSSDFEKVPASEMGLTSKSKLLSQDEILNRVNKLVGQTVTFKALTSNCESVARSIVEGDAYTTQGSKANAFSRMVLDTLSHTVLSIKVKGLTIQRTAYGKDKARLAAEEIARKLAAQKHEDAISVQENFDSLQEQAQLDLLKLALASDTPSDNKDLLLALGMKDPQAYEKITEKLAEAMPGIGDYVRQLLYRNYLLMLFTLVNSANVNRSDSGVYRFDKGKPCGESFIPENFECHDKDQVSTVKAAGHKRSTNPLRAVAFTAGLIGLSLASAARIRHDYRQGFTKSAELAKKKAETLQVEKLPPSQENIVFGIGGIAFKNSKPGLAAGTRITDHIANGVSNNGGNDMKLIPVENSGFNVHLQDEAMSDIDKARFAANVVFNNVAKKGRNPVAVDLAANILAWSKENPDKPIHVIGFSMGGMTGLEAHEILHKIDPKLADRVNYITVGTPYFGLNKKPKKYTGVGASGDVLTSKLPTLDAKIFNGPASHDEDYYFEDKEVKEYLKAAIYGTTETKNDALERFSRFDKKGQPCGEGFIASDRECHVGEAKSTPIRELKKQAAQLGIYRYSYMNKEQLERAVKIAKETPEQRQRLRKTLERERQRQIADPVEELRRLVGAKKRWNTGNVLRDSLTAGATVLGISGFLYGKVRDRYRGNFAESAETAKNQAQAIKVEPLRADKKTGRTEKSYITFTVDGMSSAGTSNRDHQLETMLKEADPEGFGKKHHFVSIPGNEFAHLDIPQSVPQPIRAAAESVQKISRQLGNTMVTGRNPQAVELAANVYAYHQAYNAGKPLSQQRPINLIGHHEGGMTVNEAAEILKQIDIADGSSIASNLRVINLGTPHFGLTEQVAKTTGTGRSRTTGRTITISSGKDGLNLFPKLNNQQINTIKGGEIKDYVSDPRALQIIKGIAENKNYGRRANPSASSKTSTVSRRIVARSPKLTDEELSNLSKAFTGNPTADAAVLETYLKERAKSQKATQKTHGLESQVKKLYKKMGIPEPPKS